MSKITKTGDDRTIAPRLVIRDVNLLRSILTGAVTMTLAARPAAPVRPADDADGATWRTYALDQEAYPGLLDAWRVKNAPASRMLRAFDRATELMIAATKKAAAEKKAAAKAAATTAKAAADAAETPIA